MTREARPSSKRTAVPADGAVRTFRLRYADEDLLVVSAPVQVHRPETLSPAQLEVAQAVARGASNAAIARARGTSVRTVSNQVSAIFARLGVTSRQQLAAAMARTPRR
jgi:DNA-binding NarL/FixJ family response regulator